MRRSIGLTRREREVRDHLAQYMAENDGQSPTYEELAEMSGVTKSAVYETVNALIAKGHARRLASKASRALVLNYEVEDV